ncbi:MAG: MFS transporter [Pyrobaculum sp.]
MNRLASLFLAVAIHMVGFGAVIPSMPYILRELGGDATAQGLLVALFSLMQLATAPLWGHLSDRLGRAAIASLGLFLAAAGHAAAYLAGNLGMLAVGRAVAGIGGGTLPALQAMFIDLTPAERRASSMAMFGAAFGIGFVLGPALGGILAAFSSRLPFLAAALLSTAAGLLIAGIPNVRSRAGGGLDLTIGRLALPILLLNLAFSMYEGLFTYFAAFAASLTARDVGFLMALAGIAAGLGQPVVRRLEGRLDPRRGAAMGLVVTALGLTQLALALEARPLLYIGVLTASLGQVVAGAFIFTLASKTRGGLGLGLGALQSAGAFGRILGPSLGGFLYVHFTPSTPFIAATLIVAAIVPMMYHHGGR